MASATREKAAPPAATDDARLSSSLEDYLEAVLDLVTDQKVARVRDIARRLKVGMPSVTVALRALAARGLVNYDPYQFVTLTERGRRMGLAIGNRHRVLGEFFTDVLGLPADRAGANACRIEHAIDEDVLARLGELSDFLRQCPRVGAQWSKARGTARLAPKCRKCPDRPSN